MNAPVLAVIPTIGGRQDLVTVCVTSCLMSSHVQGVLVGFQGELSPSFARRLKLLGGALDKQVTVLQSPATNIPTARQFLLERAWTEWLLFVDDDMLLHPEASRQLWEAREGYEGLTGLVHLATDSCLTDVPHNTYPDGFGALDHVSLVKRTPLLARGGFLPLTQVRPEGRAAGEDILASSRLWVKDIGKLVGVEMPSASTWDRKGQPVEMVTQSVHIPFPGEPPCSDT